MDGHGRSSHAKTACAVRTLEVRGGNCEPILISLSRRREREIDDHSTSRANHYFRHEHLVCPAWACDGAKALESSGRWPLRQPLLQRYARG